MKREKRTLLILPIAQKIGFDACNSRSEASASPTGPEEFSEKPERKRTAKWPSKQIRIRALDTTWPPESCSAMMLVFRPGKIRHRSERGRADDAVRSIIIDDHASQSEIHDPEP